MVPHALRQHLRKHPPQPAARRADPANASLNAHRLAGDPEPRSEPDASPDRRKRLPKSAGPPLVGRIAGSGRLEGGADAAPAVPPVRPVETPGGSVAAIAHGAQPATGDGPAPTQLAAPEPKKRRFWSRKRNEPHEDTSELDWLFGGAAAGAATAAGAVHPPANRPPAPAGPAAPAAAAAPAVDPSMAWPEADAPAPHVASDPSMAVTGAVAVGELEQPPAAAEAEPIEAEAELVEPVEAEAEPDVDVAEAEPIGAEAEPVEPVEAEPEVIAQTAPDEAATAPQPSTADGATPAGTNKRTHTGSTRRRVLVGGGILLAAAVAVGVTVAVKDSGSSSSKASSTAAVASPVTRPTSASPSATATRPAAPPTPTALSSAETWLRANIPATMAISADPNLVGQLQRAGFTAAHVLPGTPGAQDWHADGIVVSTAKTRALAASTPLVNAELASSIPVAVFGTGTQGVEVRMVFGTANPDVLTVQAQRLADATNRRIAGDGLLRNPRVKIAPQWTTLVATGGLDLRAAVVIALIANQTNVGVITVVVDPGENAAGMPARTVRLSMPSWVLPTVLPALPSGYRPGAITTITRDNTQLTQLSWGVTLTPQPTLS